MKRSRKAACSLLGLTALTVGCGKKPAPVAATPAQQEGPRAETPAIDSNRDAEREAQLERERRLAVLRDMVFFDYDDSRIRADAKQRLDDKVPILRELPALGLTIEGHADERGSTEYNIALGMRRAVSIRDYLAGFGLDAQRFQPVSYGEERPLAQGRDESAWSRNRRGQFVVSGGPGEQE